MERNKIQKIRLAESEDGTSTIYNAELDEYYHSLFGSYNESMHIYINSGFNFLDKDEITIFEVGFGSGLNTFLTLVEALKKKRKVIYFTIEKFPIPEEIYHNFVLPKTVIDYKDYFITLHQVPWNKKVILTENFVFKKILGDWTEYTPDFIIDLVYYDAFSYEKQPQMWSQNRFDLLYKVMSWGGSIVTYASKGIIKRNMRGAGFEVKRLPGPAGKRHMVRAIKKDSI